MTITMASQGCGSCTRSSRPLRKWVAKHLPVTLAPALGAGFSGWCVVFGPGGCRGTRAMDAPIVAEGGEGQFGPSVPQTTTGWAITEPTVAMVALSNGQRFRTYPDHGLPDHMRALVVELTQRRGEAQPGRQLLQPTFMPLDAAGHVMAQRPTGVKPTLVVMKEGTGWRRRQSPPPARIGACRLFPAHKDALVAESGAFLTKVLPFEGALASIRHEAVGGARRGEICG